MAGGQKKRFFGEIFATVRLFPSCFFVFSVFWVMVRGLGTLQFATGRLFSDDRFFFDSCVEDGGYICDRNGFCDMFTLGLRGDMGAGVVMRLLWIWLCVFRSAGVWWGAVTAISQAYPTFGLSVGLGFKKAVNVVPSCRSNYVQGSVCVRSERHNWMPHKAPVIHPAAAKERSPPPPSAVLAVQPPPDFIAQPHVCGGV